MNKFSKELIEFLSVTAATENLCFTQKKEELGLFTEAEANEILDSINALKDEEDVIHKTNEKTVLKTGCPESILILRKQKFNLNRSSLTKRPRRYRRID